MIQVNIGIVQDIFNGFDPMGFITIKSTTILRENILLPGSLSNQFPI